MGNSFVYLCVKVSEIRTSLSSLGFDLDGQVLPLWYWNIKKSSFVLIQIIDQTYRKRKKYVGLKISLIGYIMNIFFTIYLFDMVDVNTLHYIFIQI